MAAAETEADMLPSSAIDVDLIDDEEVIEINIDAILDVQDDDNDDDREESETTSSRPSSPSSSNPNSLEAQDNTHDIEGSDVGRLGTGPAEDESVRHQMLDHDDYGIVSSGRQRSAAQCANCIDGGGNDVDNYGDFDVVGRPTFDDDDDDDDNYDCDPDQSSSMMSPPGSHYHSTQISAGSPARPRASVRAGLQQQRSLSLSSLSMSLSQSSSPSSRVMRPQAMPPLPPIQSQLSSTGHSHHSHNSHPPHHHYQSSFRQCLKGIRVAPALQRGVPCIRVYASGSKVDQCWLTLSRDKFILYLSTQPLYNNHNIGSDGVIDNNDPALSSQKKKKKGGSWLSGMLGFGGNANGSGSGGDIDVNSTSAGSGLSKPSSVSQRSASEASKLGAGASGASASSNGPTVTGVSTRSNFMGISSNTKQSIRAIDIGAITRIQRGYTNRRFEQTLKRTGGSSVRNLLADSNNNSTDSMASSNATGDAPFALNPSMCFSLIFRGDWTLDLMMLNASSTSSSPLKTLARSTLGRSSSSPVSSSSPMNNISSSNRNSSHGQEVSRDEILDGLDLLLQTYQRAKRLVVNDVLLLRYVWLEADKDQSNTIKPNEIGGVLNKINYCQLKKSQLADLYDNFAKVIGLDKKQRNLGLTFEQTCTLLHKIKRDSWVVKPVNQYWNILFGEIMKNGKPRQTVSDKTFLEKFLHNSQGETSATLADVHRLFARLNDMELPYVSGEGTLKDPRRIDKNRFEAFLLSRENDAFDPRHERYDERTMNRPISEYWINSSHNTYLTGDQLTSASSIDMYSNALYRGCKCLELDVWDGGYDGDSVPVPVVWHGHTMTSKILFKDIIKAIKLYLNFHPDSFPIILSFENHCSVPYQEVMAEQLVRILGNSLYVPKEESLLGRLPSPVDLRGMVVIKGRRPLNMDVDDYDVDLSDDEDGTGAPSTAPSSSMNYMGGDLAAASAAGGTAPKVHHRVSPALARLTLLHGAKLKGWDASVMSPTHHMHSFSESRVRSLCKKTDRRKWVIYNQSHMSRAYPAGSRVDSSNYLPCLPWSVGTQMVALNFQTIDAPLLLNDGRFRENGNCGYVLKPSSLMDIQEQLQQQSSGRMAGSYHPLRLSIRILSGSCLPKPDGVRSGSCIDPYVKVTVYDVQNGTKESVASFQTPVVNGNGFFPIWNSDKMQFVVENPAVAMLQLSVYDKRSGGVLATPTAAMNPNSGDTFVAGATIPISCLRRGLRSVKLFDTSNTRSGAFDFAALLIEVRKNDRSKTTTTVSGSVSVSSSLPVAPGPVPTSPKMLSRSRGSSSSRKSAVGGAPFGSIAEF